MGWSTQEYIKYMLVAILLAGVTILFLIEQIGHYVDYGYSDGVPYIPSHINNEGFQATRTPATIMMQEPTDINNVGRYQTDNYATVKPPDMSVLRAQRNYDLPDDPVNRGIVDNLGRQLPPSRLFSTTQEMPSTYMIDLLQSIRHDKPDITLDSRKLVSDLRYGDISMLQLLDIQHEDIQQNPTLADLFTQIRIHIISKINESAIQSGQSHPAHPFQLFQIIKSWNIGIDKPQPNENTLRFIVNLVIYRGQATHTFNIQAWVDMPLPQLDENGNNIRDNNDNRRTIAYIHTLELVGSDMSYDGIYSDQHQSLSATDGNVDSHTLAPLSTVRIPTSLKKYAPDIAMDNTEAVNVNLDAQTQRYLDNQIAERQRLGFDPPQLNIDTQGAQAGDLVAQATQFDQRLYGPYKCYIIDKQGEVVHLDRVVDPQECQSFHPKYGSIGVWDKPCTSDAECPFYGANTNSAELSKLGGCQLDTGKCQMPEGVVRVGYRQYAKKSEPRCHNCDLLPKASGERMELEEQDACCGDQARAIKNGEISMLKSPDYKFANDKRTIVE